jgi:hypothetical protein
MGRMCEYGLYIDEHGEQVLCEKDARCTIDNWHLCAEHYDRAVEHEANVKERFMGVDLSMGKDATFSYVYRQH